MTSSCASIFNHRPPGICFLLFLLLHRVIQMSHWRSCLCYSGVFGCRFVVMPSLFLLRRLLLCVMFLFFLIISCSRSSLLSSMLCISSSCFVFISMPSILVIPASFVCTLSAFVVIHSDIPSAIYYLSFVLDSFFFLIWHVLSVVWQLLSMMATVIFQVYASFLLYAFSLVISYTCLFVIVYNTSIRYCVFVCVLSCPAICDLAVLRCFDVLLNVLYVVSYRMYHRLRVSCIYPSCFTQ